MTLRIDWGMIWGNEELGTATFSVLGWLPLHYSGCKQFPKAANKDRMKDWLGFQPLLYMFGHQDHGTAKIADASIRRWMGSDDEELLEKTVLAILERCADLIAITSSSRSRVE